MQKILYLFFFLYTSFGFAQTTFNEWFPKGLDAKNHHKFEEAIRCFDECIKITSPKPKATQMAEAYTERAYCKNQKPLLNYASAKLDCDASIQLHPTLAAYQLRGNINISLQDFRGAIADFTSAIALNSNGFQLYLLRGKCYCSLKEWEESIPDFRKTHQLSPQNEESLALIARCYYELERIDEGIKACENYFAKGFQNGKNAGEMYYYFGHFLGKKARKKS